MTAIRDEQIWEAARALGLDPWETEFEVVPANVIYDVAARALPGRYSHWTFGKSYWRQKWSYDQGHSRIYELVINTRPARAFLLEGNREIEHLLVKAHVLAHVDFFRHNLHFKDTDRQMDVLASVRADRIASYEAEHGREPVEEFLTACLAFEWCVDPDEPFDPQKPAKGKAAEREAGRAEERGTGKRPEPGAGFRPTRDILAFLLRHADHLEDWQRDILAVVRAESLYFLPQARTKIANEGWASYWHGQILRNLPLSDGEYVEYAKLNAAVTSPHPTGINPYHLGLAIMRDIERTYGKERLFEVRCLESDVSLIRNYLSREVIEKEGLFLWEVRRDGNLVVTESEDWEKVRNGLANSLANLGQPEILVVDPNHQGRRELLLHHNFDGRELHQAEALKALQHLYSIWQRPVTLRTVVNGMRTLLSYDARGPNTTSTGEAIRGYDRWSET